jgi:hypothetical protein
MGIYAIIKHEVLDFNGWLLGFKKREGSRKSGGATGA